MPIYQEKGGMFMLRAGFLLFVLPGGVASVLAAPQDADARRGDVFSSSRAA